MKRWFELVSTWAQSQQNKYKPRKKHHAADVALHKPEIHIAISIQSVEHPSCDTIRIYRGGKNRVSVASVRVCYWFFILYRFIPISSIFVHVVELTKGEKRRKKFIIPLFCSLMNSPFIFQWNCKDESVKIRLVNEPVWIDVFHQI